MKKLYTLMIGLSFVGFSVAQNLEVYSFESETIGSTEISGTTFNLTVSSNGTITEHFYIKNTSGSTKNLLIQRLILSEVSGWDDYLCWGRPTTEGVSPQNQCYSSFIMSSSNWTCPSQNYVTVPADSGAELISDYIVNGAGTSCYRYYFREGSTKLDSLDVCVTKTVSIEENEELSFAVYPNPANDVINISTKGTDGNSVIRITDVLGKVILQEAISENKKLDVSDFKNGVYLINVIENGISTKSKRIVVRH